jgi:hypothetical protein
MVSQAQSSFDNKSFRPRSEVQCLQPEAAVAQLLMHEMHTYPSGCPFLPGRIQQLKVRGLF